jgi:glycosyltransferase involved in cell wall biosynthesis
VLASWALEIVRRHRINGIVCQDPLLGGVAGVHVGRLTRVPTLVELHSDLYFGFSETRRPWARMLAWLSFHALRTASMVRVSGDTLRRALTNKGVDDARMVLVPYRVDTEFFRRQNSVTSDPRFVSVGRFIPQKGYVELLHAFAAARPKIPEATLTLVGGGPLEAELRRNVQTLGIEDAVTLHGWATREQQRQALAEASVYLQPSVANFGEWMPRTILEAMAMRLPVIATRVGGIGDVVRDAESGLLLEPGDEGALVGGLIRLGSDRQEREAFGVAAEDDARKRFAWPIAFDAYRAALKKLVAR